MGAEPAHPLSADARHEPPGPRAAGSRPRRPRVARSRSWRPSRVGGGILQALEPPPLDPEIRAKLVEGYREDVLRLQGLIGRDLSAWPTGAHKAGTSIYR
jgi:hypothetical protein